MASRHDVLFYVVSSFAFADSGGMGQGSSFRRDGETRVRAERAPRKLVPRGCLIRRAVSRRRTMGHRFDRFVEFRLVKASHGGNPNPFPNPRHIRDLMNRRLLRSEAGVGADGEFSETGFGAGFAGHQRAEDRGEEAERDADDAGIFQREKRCVLDEMARRCGDGGGIDGHDRRADEDEADGAE